MDNAVIVNILDDAQQGSPADQVPTLRKVLSIGTLAPFEYT
jgi:hypothetical protein